MMLLALGVIFLLGDLNIWNFWGISWWTALFLLGGVGHVAMSKCPDCQAMKMPKKK